MAERIERTLTRTGRPDRPGTDVPRRVAFDLLRAVAENGAYANLELPKLITAGRLSGRDAAFATELAYGTARASGTLDEIISVAAGRAISKIDVPVRDLLRLGAYQLLRTRVPAHAAVASTVELARHTGNGRASGFINAVLRSVSAADWAGWTARLAANRPPLDALALAAAHPTWIAQAFADALGGDLDDLARALAADDERPLTHLVAFPGQVERAELLEESGGEPGPWSPYAVRLDGGDPGNVAAIRTGAAAVQDEGSQLCAIAFSAAPVDGRDERWLDLCAGPGGKAALIAALAADRGATVTANEVRPHRAELVARATRAWPVELSVADGRTLVAPDGGYDRVLLDAPCSGLGALRRRPESRWRRGPNDVAELAVLQRELLAAALRLVRPGGVVGYITCSPHLSETRDVVAGHDLLDARPLFAGLPDLGPGPTVQLWPHRHGTDAMFFALLRRPDPADTADGFRVDS